jgi:hypothetical protein
VSGLILLGACAKVSKPTKRDRRHILTKGAPQWKASHRKIEQALSRSTDFIFCMLREASLNRKEI